MMDVKKWLAQYLPLRAEAYRLAEEMDVLKENPSALAKSQGKDELHRWQGSLC